MSFKPDMPDIKAEYERGYKKGFEAGMVAGIWTLTVLVGVVIGWLS